MTRIDAGWLKSKDTQSVLRMLIAGGHHAYAVGGCVRNTLLGAPVRDVDIATDARPDRVTDLARSARMPVVPTGVEHGTVTVLRSGTPFEITTFRRDIATDGRRAVVAFSNRIEEDARRRDFTMNALYADSEGRVIDPLGGIVDLRARRVRFIEDAAARIREDYLRSLRFFRFHAHYGDPAQGFDPDALAAIAENLDGLAGLSRERVGAEMLKLLQAPDPAPSVAGMKSTGVLSAILPGADNTALAPLVHLERENGIEPDGIRRLAALGGEGLAGALRLSRKDARRVAWLQGTVQKSMPAAELGYRHGLEAARDSILLAASLVPRDGIAEALDCAEFGAAQTLPIRSADLSGIWSGPALGKALKAAEQSWIDSGFTLSRHELVNRATDRG